MPAVGQVVTCDSLTEPVAASQHNHTTILSEPVNSREMTLDRCSPERLGEVTSVGICLEIVVRPDLSETSMPRPQSEAEYLARLVPPSAAATGFGRRTLLKGTLASGAALSAGGLLAACGSSSGGGGGGGGSKGASGTVTFGSNQSDPVPKKAYADMVAGFTT